MREALEESKAKYDEAEIYLAGVDDEGSKFASKKAEIGQLKKQKLKLERPQIPRPVRRSTPARSAKL